MNAEIGGDAEICENAEIGEGAEVCANDEIAGGATTMMKTGIDIILSDPPEWRGKRIGLVTNHAATTGGYVSSRLALLAAGFRVVRLFSPEHGLAVTGADGHWMADGVDLLTGLPICSLYGERLAPGLEDLADIDIVLFDIPDVGVRFYTYLWTLTHVMEACARHGVPLVIADRPNPLSGDLILAEGPMLDEEQCASFIGRWKMPVRHSCTLGELALYFNATRGIGCALEVIACVGWKRHSFHEGSFVPTSPAISSFESALLYPGLCLLEATNVSEGRGTATPFRVAGAPWMDARRLAEAFNGEEAVVTRPGEEQVTRPGEEQVTSPGGDKVARSGEEQVARPGEGKVARPEQSVVARPVEFMPVEGKYAGIICKGVMLHVVDTFRFRPVSAGWRLLHLIRSLHPDHFQWAPYPTLVNGKGFRHLDLLTGIAGAEEIFEDGRAGDPTVTAGLFSTGAWAEMVRPYLLYS